MDNAASHSATVTGNEPYPPHVRLKSATTHSYGSLLVIIPALNEEKSIEQVVADVRRCEGQLGTSGVDDLKVCIIDDGSTDDTASVARQAGADHILVHKVNQGLGAAVRSGLSFARRHGFDIVVKLDADGQHDPSDIPALIAPILADEADIVYGNRFPRLTYRMPFMSESSSPSGCWAGRRSRWNTSTSYWGWESSV